MTECLQTYKVIRQANRKQLNYVKRNLQNIDAMLDGFKEFPLPPKLQRSLWITKEVYRQQRHMYANKINSIEHRIVSFHQPHVRPIVRGKAIANTEFGAKINVSLMNGYAFLDVLLWDAFKKGMHLMDIEEDYKRRFGSYPQKLMADKIYGTCVNRAKLKEIGIRLRAKPLGRSKAVDEEHVRPGERNSIEGKFGQAKTAFGKNLIKARLRQASELWIATIILVLNLVKLAGEIPYAIILQIFAFLAEVKLN